MLCILAVIVLTKNGENGNKKLVIEQAFANRQIRAMNGDIRVKKINDSTYVWTKSSWKSGKKPITDTLNIK